MNALTKSPWWMSAPRPRSKGEWCVWRVEKGGAKRAMRTGLSVDAARDLASWFRDHCPDHEVDAEINYLAGDKRGPSKVRA